MSELELQEARSGIEAMGVDTLKWTGTIGGALGVLFMTLIQAFYYFLVSMFNGTKIGFKRWLSFSTWSQLPILFAIIASIATVLFATGYVPISQLNPLTLTNLLSFESNNASLERWMDNIDLTRLWSIGLMLIGYRVWTKKSWLYCCAVVILPVLTIFGIWLAVVL